MVRREEPGEVDISRSEAVENELNRLIEKRHDRRAAEEKYRPSEELWQASVERYNAERQRQLRAEWCRATTGTKRPATAPRWRLSPHTTRGRLQGSWRTGNKRRRHDRDI
jgi:hypothetical protein